jgi:uncharacterized protein YyaL (SSP411 family)
MPFTNRLVNETSPYLRQHAHNPVDWYAWGPAALQRARELDRPIFLSIGYSACHWCHVMEHESFEDPAIGQLLNDHFVSIKVDREERPDLDQIYMTAVQLLTQHGGWPMSVFLTPDLKPFYGGTYFPPDSRYGRPSFTQVLHAIIDAWKNRRPAVGETANQLTDNIQRVMEVEPHAGDLDETLLKGAATQLRRRFDARHGGFGDAPKFPHPMDLRLLLRVWKRLGDDDALQMVTKTLDGMAMGGMYDHLGGGFHRYSTDARWLAPHFEKMLYDNALLPPAYLEAYQATGNIFYREVVEETLAYVLREMTSPEGPFYSTQDADSEGVEGKFFVWSAAEIEQVLGPEVAKTFAAVYDVTADGNWEGHNILNRSRTYEQEARLLKMPEADLRRLLDEAKTKLLAVRSRRVWPGRDDKVLTSWNGLMIAAFARAYQVLEKPEFLQAATRAADFLLQRMRTPTGLLLRTYGAGSEPKLNGYLEDYAFLIDGLIDLYEASFDPRWIEDALALTGTMIEQCWDSAAGGFFYTGKDHEALIARTKDPHDSSTPSGNAVAATALLRLAKLTGRRDLYDKAVETMQAFRSVLESSPMAAGQMLLALDFHLGPVQEFAVIGPLESGIVRSVLAAVRSQFRPHVVLAGRPPSEPRADLAVPLLRDKAALGDVTTYICRDFSCQVPAVGVEASVAALGRIAKEF